MSSQNQQSVVFDDIVERVHQSVVPANSELNIFIGPEHIDPIDLKIRRWDVDRDLKGNKLIVRKGDIIIAKRRWYLRRVGIAPHDALCSAHTIIVRPKSSLVLPEFLPILLLSNQFFNKGIEISVGSLSPTINWSALKSMKLEIPPLDVQNKIIEIYSECARTYERLLLLRNSLNQLERKVIANYCSSCPTEKNLGDIYSTTLGKTMTKAAKTHDIKHKYLKNVNVRWNKLDLEDLSEMHFSEAEREKYSLLKGDILVCEGGEVGRSAIWGNELAEDIYFQNALHRLRLKEEEFFPANLFVSIMQYKSNRGEFRKYSGVGTIAHLVQSNLRLIPIPVNSMAKMSQVDEIISNIRISLESINRLIMMKPMFIQIIESFME